MVKQRPEESVTRSAPTGGKASSAHGHHLRRAVLGSLALAALTAAGEGQAWAGTLLPERGGSPNADSIASLYAIVLVIAAAVFLLVVAALIYALVRYRASKSNPAGAQIHGNKRLEIAWTVAATTLIVVIAALSLARLSSIEHPGPASAKTLAAAAVAGVGPAEHGTLHIKVVGRQYVWMYRYPGGVYSFQEMVAPVGVTVKLDIVSVDVAHSWWIPKLGGKFDAIPGLVNHTWFRIERAGLYTGQCAELCGRNHANMLAQVRGVPPAAYARWIARQRQLISQANAAAARERQQILSSER